jgi:hypothetical protein
VGEGHIKQHTQAQGKGKITDLEFKRSRSEVINVGISRVHTPAGQIQGESLLGQ